MSSIYLKNIQGASKREHKLIHFYGQFLNIEPYELSSTSSIFLLASLNAKIANSAEKCLGTIMTSLRNANKILKSENKSIKIAYFSGDTPISQSIGGFVTGVGMANNPCRRCRVHKSDLFKTFPNNTLDDLKKNAEIAEKINKPFFGVCRQATVFDELDPIIQTPFDPMHVILEGLCRRITVRLINELINTNRANLDLINTRIQQFPYPAIAPSKPAKIFDTDLKKGTHNLTASQMKSFMLVLPMIFEGIIDTDHDEYK